MEDFMNKRYFKDVITFLYPCFCIFNCPFLNSIFQFRLKQSGIENLMYIVESIDKSSRFSVPLPSLLQASVNCLIQDGFTVKYTRNHKDSMSYLSYVTKILIKIYKVCKEHCILVL